MSDEPIDATESPRPDETHEAVEPDHAVEPAVDLAAAERDLAAVDAALVRLDAGTYWTDEVTGETIPDHVLEADPLARRKDPA